MSLTVENIKSKIWEWLSEIPDPEIPVVSITDMGIVRDVVDKDEGFTIIITPTYSGCPAMKVFEKEIKGKLANYGFQKIAIEYQYAPAWTTDWMSSETRSKLKAAGIAPPAKRLEAESFQCWHAKTAEVRCAYCDAENTVLKSEFGSTACKALYFCNDCQQPFEYFKCI